MTALGVARVIKLKPRLSLANAFPFVRTLLSVALISTVVVPAYALEALTDDSMSNATGEGLAFDAQNFQFQMPSVAGDVSQSGTPQYGNFYGTGTNSFGLGAAAYQPGNYGSYVYLSPLGSVPANYSTTVNNYALGSTTITTTGSGTAASPYKTTAVTTGDTLTPQTTTFKPNRADVFIYGLSLSESNSATGIGSVTTTAGSACTPSVYGSGGTMTTYGSGCIGTGSVAAPADGAHGTTARNALFNSVLGTGAGTGTVGTGGGGINWGTGINPFTLSVGTTSTTGTTNYGLSGASQVAIPYLQFAAPQNTFAATDPSNNLRLGFWMNILQEDMTSPTLNQNGNNTLGVVGTAGPALQIQALWDGFGINGTVINAFPTDPCSSGCQSNPAGSATNPGNSNYANVLGFSGFIRLNSQASGVLRLSVGGVDPTNSKSPTLYGQFDQYEGLYLQNLDINLPLGNTTYQPFILSSGVTAFGTTGVTPTISLELAQIPNAPNVYNQFYINYDPNCTVSGIYCTSATGNTYGNGAGAIGLTPAAGMCSSGFTAASCPTTATHGNISLGNVYTNTTGTNQYNYVTYMYDATTQNSYSTGTACPNSGDTCYTAVPAATCPQGLTCTAPVVATMSAGCPTQGGNGVCNVLYAGASDAAYVATSSGGIATATTNNTTGTVFKMPGASGAAVNLGNAAISGLMINHLKMTLTGL